MGDIWVMALINMATQVSTVTWDFGEQHGYDMYPVKQMLHLGGTEAFSIPYLGYTEAIVRISPIRNYDEHIPMPFLKSSSPFSLRVPVQLGTIVLDRAMAKITIEELTNGSATWQQTYISTVVMARVAGTAEMKNDDTPSIDAPLVTTKSTVIPPFGCK